MKIQFSPRIAVGVILIVFACMFWYNDMARNKNRERGAAQLRAIAAQPVMTLGVRPTPAAEDEQTSLYTPCSEAVISNIIERLSFAAAAEEEDTPALTSSYDLFLFFTNRARAYLRIRRAPGSDDLLVNFRQPVPDKTDPEERFIDFQPALVTGLGAIFDEIDSGTFSGAGFHPAPTITPILARVPGILGMTKEQASDTALSLRHIGTLPFAAVHTLTQQQEKPVLGPRFSDEQAATIAAALQAAEPVETFPESEGRETALQISLKNGPAVLLRTVVLDVDPEAAYLGFYEVMTNQTIRISEPARVPGIGAIVTPFLPAPAEPATAEPAAGE